MLGSQGPLLSLILESCIFSGENGALISLAAQRSFKLRIVPSSLAYSCSII